jgi:hypothetical protein
MWGLRDMDPGKLGGLIDTASEVNQRRMTGQEAADASRRGSMNSLAGTLDANDVNYDRGLMDLQGKYAGNESRWAGENLKSQTELQKEGLRGASAERAAGIVANPKSMMKIPDMTLAQIFLDFKAGKLKPDEMKRIMEFLTIMRNPDPGAAMQGMLESRMKETPMVNPAGPSRWSPPANLPDTVDPANMFNPGAGTAFEQLARINKDKPWQSFVDMGMMP